MRRRVRYGQLWRRGECRPVVGEVWSRLVGDLDLHERRMMAGRLGTLAEEGEGPPVAERGAKGQSVTEEGKGYLALFWKLARGIRYHTLS